MKKKRRLGLGRDIWNTCAKCQGQSLKNGVDICTFVRKACEICAVAFNYLVSAYDQLWAINTT